MNRPPRRVIRRTVLLVGEGDAECLFLRHIRSTYTSDNMGAHLRIGNAHGKGAANVVDYALRMATHAAYDSVGALLDTDTDWRPAVQKRAKSARIQVLQSTPCIEAWLLAIAGECRECDSAEHKIRFRKKFGDDAHKEGLIPQIFSKQLLDAKRVEVKVLNDLLTLIGV